MKRMGEDNTGIIVVGFIAALIILGFGIVIAVCWPVWFPEDKTPTKYLRMEIEDDDEHVFHYEGEVLDIFLKGEEHRFKMYDEAHKYEGKYEYKKGRNGLSDELELTIERLIDIVWKIKLKDDGKFRGSIKDTKQKGEYRWLDETDPRTNNLHLVVEFDSCNNRYQKGDVVDVVFDVDEEEFTLYCKIMSSGWPGDYRCGIDEDTEKEFITLDFDDPGGDWEEYVIYYSCYIVLWSSTNFTATQKDAFYGTYQWV
jgi:hypothetical protein